MPHRPSPRAAGRRAFIALSVLLALAACRGRGPHSTTRVDEPWRSSRAGNFGLAGNLGVASGYEVSSTIEVLDPNFPVEATQLAGDLEGVFGGALGVEYYLFDDIALVAGAEYRVFDPMLEDDVFQFGTIEQFEYYLGAHYLLPMRWLPSERQRPYLATKAAYVPSVEYDLTTRFDLPDPLNDIELLSPYRGSSYVTLAAGAGLAYEFQRTLVGRLGYYYEGSLGETSDTVPTERISSTGDPTIDDFLDSVFEELQLDVSLDPQGWIAFVGLTYYL
jgi:hypothetical protein